MLNAFRHQRLLHPSEIIEVKLGAECSTPFGIKDCCTIQSWPLNDRQQKCSTPFGIKDCCTADNQRRHTGSIGSAQRLSASKIAAPLALTTPSTTVGKCSTPFGIKDCCTHENRRKAESDGGAQRLSASKIAALGAKVIRPELGVRCSTPFGIKDCCTRAGPNRTDQGRHVLNAFRHQRLLHRTHVTICFLNTNIPVCHVLLQI